MRTFTVLCKAANVNEFARLLLTNPLSRTRPDFADTTHRRRRPPWLPPRRDGEEFNVSRPPSHCPFLNRSDSRCSDFFNLDQLRHAFKFCFDSYKTCPVYADLLLERQAARQHERNVIQLTISTRYQRTAGAAIPAASGV
jgi:hypothetical protein